MSTPTTFDMSKLTLACKVEVSGTSCRLPNAVFRIAAGVFPLIVGLVHPLKVATAHRAAMERKRRREGTAASFLGGSEPTAHYPGREVLRVPSSFLGEQLCKRPGRPLVAAVAHRDRRGGVGGGVGNPDRALLIVRRCRIPVRRRPPYSRDGQRAPRRSW